MTGKHTVGSSYEREPDGSIFGGEVPTYSLNAGRLWQRLVDAEEEGTVQHRFPGPVTVDMSEMAGFLARQGLVDDPDNLIDPKALSNYVEAMSEPEAWQGGIMPGFSYGDRQYATWLILHGKLNPWRAHRTSICAQPNLLISLAGFSPVMRACDSVAMSISPLVHDPVINEWGADEERPVLATGWYRHDSLAPPTPLELQQFGVLVRRICEVMPFPEPEQARLGLGIYRSRVS